MGEDATVSAAGHAVRGRRAAQRRSRGGGVRRHVGRGRARVRGALRSHRPRHVVLFEDNFNFLSKMCLTRMREAALAMVGMAKAAGCRVAVAGADVTDHADVYLAAGADVCILGEGDHTVVEVVDALATPARAIRDYDGIDGIAIVCHEARCARRGHARSSDTPTCSADRPATSSTSRPTAGPGSIITVASRSTWSARVAARIGATGAPSRSGDSGTPCARRAMSPRSWQW